ncbi:ABC transporter substrate-binding protein [Streptomyces indicus]|uniref:Multiple sugar transport system substrate-binding protein n=1 Tax=Streptomyces indicus TaxID=417292 RepID=A0A1G9HXX0_9ACTN|nr:sugar ABC transporter substrate-binding protein [Streptomyces indicus]SDL17524.1 multiple sugar transport system substrate-binding protein [Streptomyces indicus]
MQRRTNVLIAAGAALGLTMTLASCGATGSGGVTLKLVAADYGASADDSSEKYWAEVVEKFEAKNPDINVEVTVLSWSDVDAEVAKMVKAGEAPDMAQIGAYSDYAAQDKLYPADELLSIPTQGDFLSSLTSAGEVNRIQYGMPFASSTRLMFYNKDLFKAAGISKPPASWDELAADAALLKEDGVKYPFALPLGKEEAQAETMLWLLAGGDGYTDQVGSYTLDSETNIKTFNWLKDNLVDKGLVGPVAPAELNRQAAFDAFSKGEVGMLNGHPTLIAQAKKKGIDFGMVPLPGRGGAAKSTMGVADWMMAFKQNGHRDQIGAFLDFVYSKENVLAFSDRYNILPVTNSALDAMTADGKYKQLEPFMEALPSSQLPPVGNTSWAQVSADIKKQIGKAVAPGGNPAAVLTDIQNKARAAEDAE